MLTIRDTVAGEYVGVGEFSVLSAQFVCKPKPEKEGKGEGREEGGGEGGRKGEGREEGTNKKV